MITNKDVLWEFGKIFMESTRDQSITEEFWVLDGTSKAPSDKLLNERIGKLNETQIESIRDLVIDSIDGALNNFLWMIEQREDFDLVCYKDDQIISLRDVSDGLSVDYWNFVDMFSKFKPS